MHNDTHYGDKANVTCAPGYRLLGTDDNENVTETIECSTNGYWSNLTGCQPKSEHTYN
ncbi:hypothetical protein DPMN_117473 [Dreissena polymorpha]|uniref:Sushi domain-containing protein n=1 Tax=Dreissena polymorpha TaxID=45954 RepID=A0A9D4KPY9_DREPO|nr:hypothetical protein DPMN_117473 [Dreissena polymorpha]